MHRAKMAFSMIEGRWVYGPLRFTDGHGDLSPVCFTASQKISLMRKFQVRAVTRLLDTQGIWVGPPCTRQCRHAFARTRPLPPDRHTPSDRRGPFARRCTSRLKRYNMSDLRGLTRHVGHFHAGCSGEAPAALTGWLVMVGGACAVYYPRSPDHQQPPRKCPRTSASPATGASVAAGSPWAAGIASP